ncbi:hypothetical protein ACHAXS_002056 [Conticribra weissflogii]
MRVSSALSLSGFFLLSTTTHFPTDAFAPTLHSLTATPPKSPPSRIHSRHSSLPEHNASPSEQDPLPPSKPPLRSTLLTSSLSLLLCFLLPVSSPSPANSADYDSFTPSQRFLSELWRVVDASYLDRTFHSLDWFRLRQDAVYGKTYKSLSDARAEADAMLSQLGDRYTRYLPPAKYDSIVDAATGNVCGVGVELEPATKTNREGNRVVAGDVEASGPAFMAGVRPGDVFVEADGVRFDDGGATPDDVAVVLRGREGSKVGVVVEREGKTLDFILTREPIKITSVKWYLGEMKGGGGGKVGVIRIKNFSGTTAETVKGAMAELKGKGARKWVLDLRGNPGGLLPGGVDTASLFLEEDRPVVFVVNKNGVVDSQKTLTRGIDLDTPLVVLVDGNTASAAEVMTAALQENKRAIVAGEQTFGKGIVQTIRQLGNGNGGVAVTIARYETPEHHDINKQGIAVDVETRTDCGKDDALACLPSEVFKN